MARLLDSVTPTIEGIESRRREVIDEIGQTERARKRCRPGSRAYVAYTERLTELNRERQELENEARSAQTGFVSQMKGELVRLRNIVAAFEEAFDRFRSKPIR